MRNPPPIHVKKVGITSVIPYVILRTQTSPYTPIR